jgi:voltage-gated potassium channel
MGPVAADVSESQPAYVSEGVMRFKDRVRSQEDLVKLSRFEEQMYLPLVLSALLPIVTAVSRAATDSRVSVAVNVVAWVVFVVDLVVHMRLVRGYLRCGAGVFDLVIVIITAPWFLIPGFGASQILMLARLARVVRLVFVSKGARRAAERLGRVGIFSVGMLLFCSWMAYVAEKPTNPEFSSFGAAVWWGIVTLTTVGYGDIVPITRQGRVAGTFLMVTGVATLGLISATLASMFRLTPSGRTESQVPASGEPPPDVLTELASMRQQLDTIQQHLAALAGAQPDEVDE